MQDIYFQSPTLSFLLITIVMVFSIFWPRSQEALRLSVYSLSLKELIQIVERSSPSPYTHETKSARKLFCKVLAALLALRR